MHKGKKHTESSYQPIKDKSGKVILTSEQARNVDEDHHEFDHKPSQSDVDKTNFINSKMKKMRKQSQGRKAVKDANKVINSIKSPINHQIAHKHSDGSKHGYMKPAVAKKSALNMLGISRTSSPLNFKGANSSNSSCWKGYKKVGTKPSPSGTGETVNDCKKI